MKNIQAAILSTAGPVVTHRSFKKSYPRLKIITDLEYQQAVDDLVQSELGQLITLRMERAPRPTDFYIKPKPIDDTY